MAFGVVAGLGNSIMQGASIFSASSPAIRGSSDPDGPEARPDHHPAQYEIGSSVAFDPAGGGAGGNGLGKGFDAVGVATEQHLDPETGTVVEGGGSIFFNVDGGYDSDVVPGFRSSPPR